MLLALLTLPLALVSSPQETAAAPASVLERMEEMRARAELPALAAALVTTDGLAGVWATGTRSAGGEARVAEDDVWHLGSCTKSMTATLIALLVARGDLSWDTPLGEALPDLATVMEVDYLDVTLVQLLCHRAGIRPNGGPPDTALGLVEQRAKLVREALTTPPTGTVGETFLYSNLGFTIAGHVAEVATGRSWEELMRTLLFEPLGMASAGFGPPGVAGADDQPRGHDPSGTPLEPGPEADNPAVIGPAGTVHASLADWAKYVQLHLRGAHGDVRVGELTLTRDDFALLHTAYEGDGQPYGFGWVMAQRDWAGGDGAALWHNGSNTLWFCVTWLGLEKGVAALVTTNRFTPAATRVADDVAALLLTELPGLEGR